MKVKLNSKNFPKVINSLKNILEKGPLETKHQYSFKGFKENKISEEHKDYYRTAKVIKHWSANLNEPSKPLIHINFGDGHFFVLCEGDIVDLKNGSHLVIRQESKMIKEVFKETSLTTSFKLVSLEDIEDLLLNREVERADESFFYNSMVNEESESFEEEDLELEEENFDKDFYLDEEL